MAELHLEKMDQSIEKIRKERSKPVTILRPAMIELETNDDRA